MALLAQRDVCARLDSGQLATNLMRLRGGRRLACTDLGDPDGVPIIHRHGMPGSRLEHLAESEFYRLMGVRLITPEVIAGATLRICTGEARADVEPPG